MRHNSVNLCSISQAHSLRAECLSANKKFKEAVKAFRKAIRLVKEDEEKYPIFCQLFALMTKVKGTWAQPARLRFDESEHTNSKVQVDQYGIIQRKQVQHNA